MSRASSIDETSRVPVIEYARTRIFRQAPEVRAPARAERQPEARATSLAHPRLVPRPPTTPPPLPRLTLRPTTRDQDFEDEPTGEVAGRSHDATRPRDVTATRPRR
jgi:hypothetical protein